MNCGTGGMNVPMWPAGRASRWKVHQWVCRVFGGAVGARSRLCSLPPRWVGALLGEPIQTGAGRSGSVRRHRIAFVTNIIPHYRVSFFEKLCADPAVEWLVVHGGSGESEARVSYEGRIRVPRVFVENREYLLGPLSVRLQYGALSSVRSFRPDCLVVLGMVGNLSNWVLLVWGVLRGVRVFIWACGWEPQVKGSLAHRVKALLSRWYFGMARHTLVYSTRGAEYLIGMGVPRQKISVCFNGIDIDGMEARREFVEAEGARRRLELSAGARVVFLYVGGLAKDKRVDLLLDAVQNLDQQAREFAVWVIGEGPRGEELRARSEAAGLSARVRFLGRIVDGVDAYFAGADWLVLPGVGGLAMNQAMAWGTPCIVGEGDGTEDDLVLEGATGLRFFAGNSESLSDAMRRALAMDCEGAREMGSRGEYLVRTRSNVGEMVGTFRRVLAEGCVAAE